MKLYEYQLFGNVSLEGILKLMDPLASYFTMTSFYSPYRNLSGKLYHEFKQVMQEHQLFTFSTEKWYCYITKDPCWLNIFVFPYTNETRGILTTYFNNLFLEDEEENTMDTLQDLCFFRQDGTLILGTVSHEHICDLVLHEDELVGSSEIKPFKLDQAEEFSEDNMPVTRLPVEFLEGINS